jgi:hypothetical protein
MASLATAVDDLLFFVIDEVRVSVVVVCPVSMI